MSTELVILIMFGGLMVFLIAGIPIAFTMAGIGVAVIYMLWGTPGPLLLVSGTFTTMTSLTYIALPLYIFMGVALERSGIADALFEIMHRWSGQLRGGLAIGTVVICTVFAAMTGVVSAATITMGLIAIPAMLNRGYDKSIALGTVAGAGTLGILIPPSIFMIILAPMTKLSMGKMFMGGVFPGLLLMLLFIAYIGIRGFFQPHLMPVHEEKFTLRQKIISTREVILPIFIILSVLGSIFWGIATATEAGAVGATACLIAIAVRRRLTWPLIKAITVATLRITGMCMWIFFGAMVFTNAFAAGGGVSFVSDFLLGVSSSPWVILLTIMGIVFIMGFVLEPIAIIFLVAPIAFPLIKTLGFDPIWFTILFIINIQMGCLTPPYGYTLFILKSVVPPGVSMMDIYRSTIPFLAIMMLGMAVIMLFPQIVTWLPEMMMR